MLSSDETPNLPTPPPKINVEELANANATAETEAKFWKLAIDVYTEVFNSTGQMAVEIGNGQKLTEEQSIVAASVAGACAASYALQMVCRDHHIEEPTIIRDIINATASEFSKRQGASLKKHQSKDISDQN